MLPCIAQQMCLNTDCTADVLEGRTGTQLMCKLSIARLREQRNSLTWSLQSIRVTVAVLCQGDKLPSERA